MKKRFGKQQVLLALALVGTVVAAVFAPRGDDEDALVQPTARTEKNATTTGATSAVADVPAPAGGVTTAAPPAGDGLRVLPLLPRRLAAGATLFVTPPPPKPVFVAAAAMGPPVHVDPPLPAYRVVGRYDNGNSTLVLLASGQETLEVSSGDTVANGWRVGRIDDSGIVFVSPSGKEQLLATDDGH